MSQTSQLLKDHQQMLYFVVNLEKLERYVLINGIDNDVRRNARTLIEHFSDIKEYQNDEEKRLFPLLLEAVAGSEPVCINEMINSIKAIFRNLQELWQELEPLILKLSLGEKITLPSCNIAHFKELIRKQIAIEEKHLIPLANRLLSHVENLSDMHGFKPINTNRTLN